MVVVFDRHFVRYSDYAALEAQLAERVKVKQLEWSGHPAGGEQALAAGLGLYRVHANGDDWYLVPDHMGKGGKAAAQADFERRVLSALEATPPAPKVTDAMVDAAERTMAAHYERPLKAWELTALHEALTAAQEAGQ